jgi:hypothetical protein
MANQINFICPYKYQGMWVFDDERVGLDREPFVAGADTLIDRALEMKKLMNPERGFRLIFSAGEFPGFDVKFDWLREGEGGNWYWSEKFQMEGWLCPALLKYFDNAPKNLYARFENK